MAPRSMTAFARASGASGDLSWDWEIRTVNARGLDLRLRLPNGFDALDGPVREACRQRLTRGNCSLNLSVQRDASAPALILNEDALRQAHEAAKRAAKIVDGKPARVDTLLALRGVIEVAEPQDAGTSDETMAEIRTSLDEALDQIDAARAAEGARLGDAIAAQVNEIERLTRAAYEAPGRSTDAIRTRLAQQIERLTGVENLDPVRLNQEAAMLATKADIAEELDRLNAHVAQARDLLASEAPVGRKLEFLAQEFNREANTTCAKAGDAQIVQIGLDLKAVIDQLREQVQNLE